MEGDRTGSDQPSEFESTLPWGALKVYNGSYCRKNLRNNCWHMGISLLYFAELSRLNQGYLKFFPSKLTKPIYNPQNNAGGRNNGPCQ